MLMLTKRNVNVWCILIHPTVRPPITLGKKHRVEDRVSLELLVFPLLTSLCFPTQAGLRTWRRSGHTALCMVLKTHPIPHFQIPLTGVWTLVPMKYCVSSPLTSSYNLSNPSTLFPETWVSHHQLTLCVYHLVKSLYSLIYLSTKKAQPWGQCFSLDRSACLDSVLSLILYEPDVAGVGP